MPPDVTYCCRCEHVHGYGRNEHPWRWMCMKRPRPEGYGYVTDSKWDRFPPYLYCRDVNPDGKCRSFEPRRAMETE